eukprot:g3279.t1
MITQQRIFGTNPTQESSLGVYNNVGKSKFTPTQPSRQPARSGPRSPRERKFNAAHAGADARNLSNGLFKANATSPKVIFADADINLHNSTTGIPSIAKVQKDVLQSPNSVRNIGNVNNAAAKDKAKPIHKNIAAAVSLAGERRMPQDLEAKKKENQDSYFVHLDKFPVEIACCGVFDGHGVNGGGVSNFIAQRLPQILKDDASGDSNCNLKESINFAVARTEAELEASAVECAASGATAVFCVRRGYDLFVANIGDSRCILATEQHYKLLSAKPLSTDHKPNDPAEMHRITSMGGVVQPSQNMAGQFVGPHRVWIRNRPDIGGLAIGRTMGDTAYAAVGVVPTPDIIHHCIDPLKDRFLVLGSDGVWDRLSNDEVISIVSNNLGPKGTDVVKAGKAVASTARARWRAVRQGWYCDDITVCVWLL